LFNKSQTALIQYPAGINGSYAIPNGVTNIGGAAFFFCSGLTGVTIPNSVTFIGEEAFCGCFDLTRVVIPDSVTSIGEEGFADCPLTSVSLGTNLISIEADAFDNCSSLTSVTIPNSVRSIGTFAFGYCGLTSVMAPTSLTNIGSGAFAQCPNLTAIAVDSGNPAYTNVNGVLFDKSQTGLIEYPDGKAGTFYTIPNSVASIREDAFWGVTSLTGITIPNSVTNVEDFAFSGCSSLTSIYFQGNAPAPTNDSVVFSGDNGIVYYLPKTTGWGSAFDGLPTVLWSPKAQTSGGSFGVRTNQFGFDITGSSNLVIVVEACTNLSDPVWLSVQTNTLTGGSAYFSDPQWTNFTGRYYRLSSQ
jgi:hypothetical protein